MDIEGLNMMTWDSVDLSDMEALVPYTVLHRKNLRDGRYQYTIMDESCSNCNVTLEGISGTDDPFQGIHKIELTLNADKTEITGMKLKDSYIIKRL